MKVILARTAGFCWGVKRAVEKARTVAKEDGSKLYTDGPLIHNREMLEQLRMQGILESHDPHSLQAGKLLIRAHGIPPDRRSELQQLPLSLIDATCPDVARIHGIIRQYVSKGFHIVILGDPGHAEVVGLQGYAGDHGTVVSKPADVEAIPDLSPVCLVSQSTQSPITFRHVAEALRERFSNVKVIDTICKSTRSRQAEIVDLAGTVDAIVVVGDTHSANSVRLTQEARKLRPTFLIQRADQLAPEKLKHYATIGLTAGASTPGFLIQDVMTALEKM